jgi:hypothetical protein
LNTHRVFRLGKALGLAAFCLIGCAGQQPKRVDFSESGQTYRPQDYDRVHRHWTRHSRLIKDIGTVLEVWATLKSWDFRQAYIEKYADLYVLGEAERASLRAAELEASREVYELHLTVQSTNYKWNDLEQKDSPWRLSLLDGTGAELAPVSIEFVKLPELYEMQFFPTRTDFSRTYVVRFSREAGEAESKPFVGPVSGRIMLRIAGPLGRLELDWQSN